MSLSLSSLLNINTYSPPTSPGLIIYLALFGLEYSPIEGPISLLDYRIRRARLASAIRI